MIHNVLLSASVLYLWNCSSYGFDHATMDKNKYVFAKTLGSRRFVLNSSEFSSTTHYFSKIVDISFSFFFFEKKISQSLHYFVCLLYVVCGLPFNRTSLFSTRIIELRSKVQTEKLRKMSLEIHKKVYMTFCQPVQ